MISAVFMLAGCNNELTSVISTLQSSDLDVLTSAVVTLHIFRQFCIRQTPLKILEPSLKYIHVEYSHILKY